MNKKEILEPTYDLYGGQTELTVCAHEAAHAVMRHHLGMEMTDIEIYRQPDMLGGYSYGGRCNGSGEECYDLDTMKFYAAGYAWEWRETLDLFDRFIYVWNQWDIGSEVNDCRRIGEYLTGLHVSEDYNVELTKQQQHDLEKAISILFGQTWKILETHYLEAIAKLAYELAQTDRLPAKRVEAIISKNLTPNAA